jgi:hypothetical protein
MTKSAARVVALSLLTLTLTASCDRTAPTTPSAPPVIRAVELIAPRTLAPGATTQLRLIARRSDGSSEDITATATFHASTPGILALSPDGIATASRVGDTFVTGHNDRFSSTHEVVVVPDGTFRVVGRVVEEETPGLPVGGVRVETDGGMPSVSTDLEGNYRLYGVPGDARLRLSKSGYITREVMLAISDHHTRNVTLALAGPRVDIAGAYQLTIDASPDCRGRLPDALLTRRYAAAITQDGASMRVVLSGATFAIGRSGSRSDVVIFGRVDAAGVVLELDPLGYYTEPTLVEIVDNTTWLVIDGEARLSPAGPGLTGTLGGSFFVYPSNPVGRGVPLQASCGVLSHRLTLTR